MLIRKYTSREVWDRLIGGEGVGRGGREDRGAIDIHYNTCLVIGTCCYEKKIPPGPWMSVVSFVCC
jgi:hypothetical protein